MSVRFPRCRATVGHAERGLSADTSAGEGLVSSRPGRRPLRGWRCRRPRDGAERGAGRGKERRQGAAVVVRDLWGTAARLRGRGGAEGWIRDARRTVGLCTCRPHGVPRCAQDWLPRSRPCCRWQPWRCPHRSTADTDLGWRGGSGAQVWVAQRRKAGAQQSPVQRTDEAEHGSARCLDQLEAGAAGREEARDTRIRSDPHARRGPELQRRAERDGLVPWRPRPSWRRLLGHGARVGRSRGHPAHRGGRIWRVPWLLEHLQHRASCSPRDQAPKLVIRGGVCHARHLRDGRGVAGRPCQTPERRARAHPCCSRRCWAGGHPVCQVRWGRGLCHCGRSREA
mmetsp:Transcript_84842/g.248674  ORF Transcript_84842/g.248674 Transcript_84842/m.248674 type:complete len:340 (+) Transcript_84842:214-1233(+)